MRHRLRRRRTRVLNTCEPSAAPTLATAASAARRPGGRFRVQARVEPPVASLGNSRSSDVVNELRRCQQDDQSDHAETNCDPAKDDEECSH